MNFGNYWNYQFPYFSHVNTFHEKESSVKTQSKEESLLLVKCFYSRTKWKFGLRGVYFPTKCTCGGIDDMFQNKIFSDSQVSINLGEIATWCDFRVTSLK